MQRSGHLSGLPETRLCKGFGCLYVLVLFVLSEVSRIDSNPIRILIRIRQILPKDCAGNAG
jgi:hypothetical protein